MDYKAATYKIPMPPGVVEKRSIGKKVACIVVSTCLLITLGIVAVALGVGLGVGLALKKNNPSNNYATNTPATTSNSNPQTPYSILSPPIVDCTYVNGSTCGCSPAQPSFEAARIVQGYAAVPNSWPWTVAVFTNDGQRLCGGFLISYQHVVTAAHCLTNLLSVNPVRVYAGLQKLSDRNNAQSRTASNVTIYPSYSASTFLNDIGIITLSSPFAQTSNVGICCLPSDPSIPQIGDHAVITGWGVTSSASTTPSDNLQQGVVQVSSDSQCSSGPATNTRFCASYAGTDVCYGDSGSPLMTSVNNAWTCSGIVSAGGTCGSGSLYTRVSAFRSFIFDTTKV